APARGHPDRDPPRRRATSDHLDRQAGSSPNQAHLYREAVMSHIRTIKRFVLDEFLPDVPEHDLATDYDLVDGGVIDSLGLLKLIAWLGDEFQLPVDDIELDPD